MKNLLCYILFLLITPIGLKSQELSGGEWRKLVSFLEDEDWTESAKLSRQYLDKITDKNSADRARLVYLRMFSLAGEVTKDTKTFDDIEQECKTYIGEHIITPGHPVKTDDKGSKMNFVVLDENKPNEVFIGAANKKGVNVHSFENITLVDSIQDIKSYDGAFAYCWGTLRDVEIHRSPLKIWILKLTIEDGHIEKME